MRRRIHHRRDNHDRWLVSYADFITLLFAFFVVMFASVRTDKEHARAVSLSIEKALRSGLPRQSFASLISGNTANKDARDPGQGSLLPKPIGDLTQSLAVLQNSLRPEIENGSVHLSLERRGLIVELSAGAFFALGDDTISASAYPILQRLSTVLNSLPNSLRLEGHTDSLPISNGRFHSNWELSAARSIAMLRAFNESYGVDRRRMAIVGYGDTVELASNQTEEGRTRNRRVDIVVLNEQGMNAEPSQTATNMLLHNSEPISANSPQQANKP